MASKFKTRSGGFLVQLVLVLLTSGGSTRHHVVINKARIGPIRGTRKYCTHKKNRVNRFHCISFFFFFFFFSVFSICTFINCIMVDNLKANIISCTHYNESGW